MTTTENQEQEVQNTIIELSHVEITAWVAATAAFRTFLSITENKLLDQDPMNLRELEVIHQCLVAFDNKLSFPISQSNE